MESFQSRIRKLNLDNKSARIVFVVLSLVFLVGINFFHDYILARNWVIYPNPLNVRIDSSIIDFNTVSFWRLFLPVEVSGYYRLGTTGWVLAEYLNRFIEPVYTLYIFSGALVVVSFLTSWFVFHSLLFSCTLALCMTFGIQFEIKYLAGNNVFIITYAIYLVLSLFCIYQVMVRDRVIWRIGYLFSLIAFALCFASWVNILAFLGLCLSYVLFLSHRNGLPEFKPRVLYVAVSSAAVALVWAVLRFVDFLQGAKHGARHMGINTGGEEDLVFNYIRKGYPIIAIDDIVTNLIKYIYMALTNYLPITFTFPTSLPVYGREILIAQQHRHNLTSENLANFDLIYGHYLLSWYLYAGIVFGIFCFLSFKVISSSLKSPSRTNIALTIFLFLIWSGFATHIFIKIRPYTVVPALGYKYSISCFGVALLISYLLMISRERIRNSSFSIGVIFFSWFLIIYAGLTKPKFLAALGQYCGMYWPFLDFFTEISWMFHN